MKVLPFIFIALLGAHLASARSWVNTKHFEVGVSAGTSINSAFQTPRNPTLLMDWNGKLHPVFNVSAAYTVKHWQYGVTAGYNTASSKVTDVSTWMYMQIYGGNEALITRPSTVSYSYIPAKLFVNRLYQSGKMQLYGGLSAGAAFLLKTNKVSDVMTRKYYDIGTQTNVMAGVQTGVSVPLNNLVAFNAEVAANFVNINAGYYVYTYPVTIGVKCKL